MTEVTPQEVQQEQPAGELKLVDIENAVRIIDVASRRGAFGANELSGVGSVFDRLSAFVAAHKPVEETPTVEPVAEAAPAPAEKPAKRKSK